MLTALAERGVPIEPDAQSAAGLWSLGGRESDAILPTMPKMLRTLAPALALCGTAIMIVLLITAEFWWMRPIIVVVGFSAWPSVLGPWWKGTQKGAMRNARSSSAIRAVAVPPEDAAPARSA